jgi:hypothetical protein
MLGGGFHFFCSDQTCNLNAHQKLVDSVADEINRHGINRNGALLRRFISLSVRDDPLPSKSGLVFAVREWLRRSAAPLPSNAHPSV